MASSARTQCHISGETSSYGLVESGVPVITFPSGPLYGEHRCKAATSLSGNDCDASAEEEVAKGPMESAECDELSPSSAHSEIAGCGVTGSVTSALDSAASGFSRRNFSGVKKADSGKPSETGETQLGTPK